MTLVVLVGPPAVGKMSVGQALEPRLGFKLFHNHVTIDMVAPYFSYATPEGRALVQKLREAFFESFAADTRGGYIFTFVCAFNDPEDQAYLAALNNQFAGQGHEVIFVELEAAFETRLARNVSENRLAHKPSKRDLVWSERNLRESEATDRMNSMEGEMQFKNYLRIDTTSLSAAEVAECICKRFGLDV